MHGQALSLFPFLLHPYVGTGWGRSRETEVPQLPPDFGVRTMYLSLPGSHPIEIPCLRRLVMTMATRLVGRLVFVRQRTTPGTPLGIVT